jgi:uncharacterized membrane protein YjgN (DUF898 family)
MQLDSKPRSDRQAPDEQSRRVPIRLSWLHPNGLVSLSLANFCLRLLTLGLYHFWGKTETRRHIWSAVRIEGEPLVYAGTGRELFLGFLIVFAVVLAPVLVSSVVVVTLFGETGLDIFQVVLAVAFFYLTGVAVYRAKRYRLSRTHWRGIRGSLEGNSWRFGWLYLWTVVIPGLLALVIPSFYFYASRRGDPDAVIESLPYMAASAIMCLLVASWIVPWRSIKLQERLAGDMRFGNRPFRFSAPAAPLYVRFAGFWLGTALLVTSVLAVAAQIISIDQLVEAGADPSPASALNLAKAAALIYLLFGLAFLVYYLLSAFYRAFQFNHFAAYTHFDGATFRGTATGPGLAWIALGNFVLWLVGALIGLVVMIAALVLVRFVLELPLAGIASQALLTAALIVLLSSSGLFRPVMEARTVGYLARNLSIDGLIDLSAIEQGRDQGITRGEGLAQAFDVDAF